MQQAGEFSKLSHDSVTGQKKKKKNVVSLWCVQRWWSGHHSELFCTKNKEESANIFSGSATPRHLALHHSSQNMHTSPVKPSLKHTVARAKKKKNTCKHHERDRISACLSCLEAEMSSDKEPRSPLFVYVSITATWQQSDSSNKDRWLVGKKIIIRAKSPSLSLGASVYINISGLFLASTSLRCFTSFKTFQVKEKLFRSHPRTWMPPTHTPTPMDLRRQKIKFVLHVVCIGNADLHVKTNIHRPPSFNHCLSIQPSV